MTRRGLNDYAWWLDYPGGHGPATAWLSDTFSDSDESRSWYWSDGCQLSFSFLHAWRAVSPPMLLGSAGCELLPGSDECVVVPEAVLLIATESLGWITGLCAPPTIWLIYHRHVVDASNSKEGISLPTGWRHERLPLSMTRILQQALEVN